MKNHIIWFITAFSVFGICFAADAQFPRPKSGTAVAQAVPAVAEPVAPPIVNVAPPAVTVTPNVTLPPPSTTDEVKSWLNTIFAGLIAALLAKIGFKPSAPSVGASGLGNVDVLLKLREKIADPALRAGIDSTLLHVVQSGIPGMAIQSGLSLVPGVGPVAATVEPMVRNIVMDVLRKRGAEGAAAAEVTAAPANLGTVIDLGAMIENLTRLIDQKFPTKA